MLENGPWTPIMKSSPIPRIRGGGAIVGMLYTRFNAQKNSEIMLASLYVPMN